MRIAALLLIALMAGCASRVPVTEAPAGSAEAQWQRLVARAARPVGHRSLARVQWESGGRRQGFDATITTDSSGHLLLEGLTPVGTTAATLWTDGDELVFLNHRNRSWWRGSLDEVPEAAPLIPVLRALDSRAAASLLFGIPAEGEERPCDSAAPAGDSICRRRGDVTYITRSAGLEEARTSGARVVYDPPSVPATALRVVTAGGMMTINYRMIEEHAETVSRPVAEPSWRCCVLPSFE